MRGFRSSSRSRSRSTTEATPLLQNEQPIQWIDTLTFVRPYVIPNTLSFRLIALLSISSMIIKKGLLLVPPYAYKLAVDQLANNLLNATAPTIPYTAVILFAVSRLLSNFFGSLQELSYSYVASDCTNRFSVHIFSHLQSLSLGFHLQRKTGEVIRIMERGVSSIDTITNTALFTLVPTILEASVVSAIFLHIGTPYIALSTIVSIVLYFAFTILVTNWRVRFRRELIDADMDVSEKVVDTLINYETVKMFGMEEEETTAYRQLRETYQRHYIWFRVVLNMLNLGQYTIQVVGLSVAMLLAAIATGSGRLSPGDFVLVSSYVQQLYQPLFFLGSSYRMITQAITDLENCLKLAKTESSVQDVSYAKELVVPEADIFEGKVGEVRFENVSFQYQESDRGNSGGLKHISFTVPPGKMVALVGASGAGKSTIIRLLMRFYDVDSGAILIDGENLKNFSQRSLRKAVGVVAQDTVLFNNTLRYNISYGKKDASEYEIYSAARSAALGEFIDGLPLKLDTVVGERGVRLSGGERQRVGTARCIIKTPAIVLLDEASSALDTLTEREVQANLREVCKNRTTIVIAHRLSTIMMADEILVLSKGNSDTDKSIGSIIERGTHSELLAKGGEYAEMWTAQTNVDKPELGTSVATVESD